MRPFRSRRSRRCACPSLLCVRGGRIRPGDWIVRQRGTGYVHVDDFEQIARAIVEAARALQPVLVTFANVVTQVARDAEPMIAAMREHEQRERATMHTR